MYLDQLITGKTDEHEILDYKFELWDAERAGQDNPVGNEGPVPYWRWGAVAQPDIPIKIIKADGNTLYIGGAFYSVNGVERKGFDAVNRITGNLLPWAPLSGSPGNTIYSILPDGDSIMISGFFLDLNNAGHCFLAKTDLAGTASNWKPFFCSSPYPDPRALLTWDSFLIVGGGFSNFNGINRKNLAMMNEHTGAVHSWNPNPDDEVLSLGANDSLIAVGGRFDNINGIIRQNLAVYSKYGQQSGTQEQAISAVRITGYPNPTRSFYTIPLEQNDLTNLAIYTTDGKRLHAAYQRTELSLIIDTRQLPTGEYIVQFDTADRKKYLSLFTVHKP